MDKKLVLLYSPKLEPTFTQARTPPLPLLAISSLLLGKGYEIKIFDALTDPDAKEKVLQHISDALCVGMSVWVGYPIADALDLAVKIKTVRPDLPVVWGGWHPSLFPEQTVENENIDFVVRGQGEETFFELVECIRKNAPPKKVLGITYKSSGKIIINPPRPRVPLDNLPPMPYNLIDVEKYVHSNRFELGKRILGYISSQGCPYQCAFCADARVYQRKRMELSAERVLGDLEILIKNYKIEGVIFEDTNFFVNKKRLIEICQGIITRGWKIKWSASERVNHFLTFTEEEIKLIKESGCILITVGAESGSQELLDFMNKGIKVEDTIKFAELCKKYDIGIKFDMIVGLPNEKPNHLNETLNLIKKIYNTNPKNELAMFFYTPYPGTPLFDLIVKDYGFKSPQTLIEWSKFDPNNIETPWVNKEYKEKLYTFLFYLQLAFWNRNYEKKIEQSPYKVLYKLMKKISLFRFKTNFFGLPVEKKIYDLIKKLNKPIK